MYCQKCRTSLKVDGSLEGLNVAAYDVLVGSTSQAQAPATTQDAKAGTSQLPRPPHEEERKSVYDEASQHASLPTFKRHGGGPRDAAMSFIYLTESQVVQPAGTSMLDSQQMAAPKSRRLSFGRGRSMSNPASVPTTSNPPPTSRTPRKSIDETDERARLNRLFEILSARSDIDHPICVECSDALVAGLQRRLEESTAERDAYARFLKEHRPGEDQGGHVTDEELRAQEEALRRAKADEADARAELVRLEKEKANVDAELLALEAEARQLDEEEEQFWRARNAFAARLQEFQSERDSVNTRFEHDAKLYERLTRTNVHNDTFSISHDGTYGTINGLRLGRLSSVPVEWPEINAAWGHALLLIVTVADKLGYRFVGYEPKPMGSTSRIWRFDQPSASASRFGSAPPPPKKIVYDLYNSGDMLGLLTINRTLNNAMAAFLELVRQLGEFVRRQMEAQGKNLGLPYPIEGDRIGGHTIKLGLSNENDWTKACKLTLTCCKFLLAHASNVGSLPPEPVSGRNVAGP
jgi:beclin 1